MPFSRGNPDARFDAADVIVDSGYTTGENRFAAVFHRSPGCAVHPSDLAPVLVMLDAGMAVHRRGGEYAAPVADLLQPPNDNRRSETILEPDAIVTEIRVPAPPRSMPTTYRKAMDRKTWAFALAGATPLRDNAYKIPLTRALIQQALESLG